MKFGPVPTHAAKGAILAHALQLPSGRLKKGHLLSPQNIADILDEGVEQLIVARLEAGDVGEDAAATRLAEAFRDFGHLESGLRLQKAFTGRVNIHAAGDGLLDVQRETIDAINAVDPAITVATLPERSLVEAGRMVATVKIIPFAVDGASLERCCALAQDAFSMAVRPAKALRVWLIQTDLPTVKASVLDKTRKRLEGRLRPSGSAIQREWRVAHDEAALASALADIDECAGSGDDRDVIVIFGASAITDRHDVIPSALESVNGTVTYLGMPVDPGNLLMIGRFGGRQVIGAPGCARSPAENGFDWVLQRLVHGAQVDGSYIKGLGVGGLLMEIHDRPQPREVTDAE